MAKFLVPILRPLTTNQYSISNSTNFVKEVCSLSFDSNIVMASFDVKSLFTNIPLKETIEIIMANISDEQISSFGLDRPSFPKFLELATCNNVFTFDKQLYNQIDGVAMGSPLGPVLADIFMNFNECSWLDNCPLNLSLYIIEGMLMIPSSFLGIPPIFNPF